MRPRQDEQDAGDRAERHQRARAVAVQVPAHGDPGYARDDEPERERARELRRAVAELALHRQQQDRERVVEDPPRDRLRDRQRADDPPRPCTPERRRAVGCHATAVAPSCGDPAPQHADAAAPVVLGRGRAVADAGLGQHQLDPARALPVAVQRGDDRADLLVACAQQERRSAPVALHTDHEYPLVGVAELVHAVRRHRPAGMQVRVDQRSQPARRLDAIVEIQPQLAEQRQVRAEASGGDHLVRHESLVAVGQHHLIVLDGHRASLEAAHELDRSVLDEAADRRAEPAAGRQLVVPSAAVLAAGRPAADRPHDVSRRLGAPERHQVEDHVERRVPAADHEHSLAGVAAAIGAQHVGDAIGDAVGGGTLTGGGDAARAERVRLRPRAGRVDDRGRQIAAFLAALVDDELERRLVAAVVLELVDAVLGDGHDARAEVQRRSDGRQRRERLEIALDDLLPRRVAARIGRRPSRCRRAARPRRDRC